MSESISDWLAGRLPDDWFAGAPEVTVDRDEVLVVGTIAAPESVETPGSAETAGSTETVGDPREAEAGRIARFREQTREARIGVAREAEARFGRKVAWGVRCGETRQLFSTLSVPVMTRLRQPERLVLDTLVDAGVARSRSDALGWAVRLVGTHAEEWLAELRTAMEEVARVRATGPQT